jgi:hypothetical protein
MSLISTLAIAHQSAAVSNTAKTLLDLGFTADQIGRASRARITADTQPIRYCYDGTTPTASIGHYMAVGAQTEVMGIPNIARLAFFRAGGSDGNISITLEE